MNAEELKARQAPLKDKYRNDPGSAKWVLQATGKIGEDITCKVDAHHGVVVAGLHSATGGTGHEACSGDMLLQALVACSGVTLAAVAVALGIHLRNVDIRAEGDLDFRGTLGVSKDVPVGFSKIRLHFQLDTDATPDKVESLLKLSERYCVVYQTLARGAEVEISHSV